jgi:hypothetical protein
VLVAYLTWSRAGARAQRCGPHGSLSNLQSHLALAVVDMHAHVELSSLQCTDLSLYSNGRSTWRQCSAHCHACLGSSNVVLDRFLSFNLCLSCPVGWRP